MNQEFKDRVANLLIDARVNAVLAEAKPEGGYGKAGPKPGFDIHGRPRASYVPPDRTPKLSPEERAKRLAAEKKQARTHGESTINQDFMDRLIIMEKRVDELSKPVLQNYVKQAERSMKNGPPGETRPASGPIKPIDPKKNALWWKNRIKGIDKANKKNGGPPVSDSTINQDFMDRLINIIMENEARVNAVLAEAEATKAEAEATKAEVKASPDRLERGAPYRARSTLKHISKSNRTPELLAAARNIRKGKGNYADRVALLKAGKVPVDIAAR
jgi:hypothetical protein